jgi:L-lactate dehydrogenase
VALATVRVIEAILRDENQVLSVTSRVTGYAGIKDDVALSLPAVINRSGVHRTMPIPLSEEERLGLYRSAGAIRNVIDKLGL